MRAKRYKRYLIQSLTLLCFSLVCLITYLVIDYSSNKDSLEETEILYVSHEILTDNVKSVLKEDDKIIRPYKDENVTIGKSFYDYKSEESLQENAIIFYENTYIQNTGVDYKSEKAFSVYSIMPGKVLSVTDDDIVGITVKVEHKNKMISTYQSLSEVIVAEGAELKTGDTIGKSGTNSFNSKMGNHLHFELYYKNKLVNPEEYYNKASGEF